MYPYSNYRWHFRPQQERTRVCIRHEEAQGRDFESGAKDNRGFDLISRKPHPEDSKTAIDVRLIKSTGHAGEIALTTNEYNTAKRLKNNYYLYILLRCISTPSLNLLQDSSTLDWQEVGKIEHYRLRRKALCAVTGGTFPT